MPSAQTLKSTVYTLSVFRVNEIVAAVWRNKIDPSYAFC